MARTPVLPWHSSTSTRAGLPASREAWLATVLPVIARSESHVATLAALPTTESIPRSTWNNWYSWLESELHAGRLPEWEKLTQTQTFPPRPEGVRPGSPPRGAAAKRHADKLRRTNN